VYASWYFARLSAASRSGLLRRAIAGVVGIALAWWVVGAIPAFEGARVLTGQPCAGENPNFDYEFGPSFCPVSPWLPIWPPGQIVAVPGSVDYTGPDPGPVPGIVPAILPGYIPWQAEPTFSLLARAVTPP
jgi:hypothetical protein